MYYRLPIYLFFLCSLLTCGNSLSAHANDDPLMFDDMPLTELITNPEWFKESFLDLQEDLSEALADDKQGIIVYFGQKRCAYCKRLMEVNFKLPDIVRYTHSNFDVIPIDIWSPEELTTPQGEDMSERENAHQFHAFTYLLHHKRTHCLASARLLPTIPVSRSIGIRSRGALST